MGALRDRSFAVGLAPVRIFFLSGDASLLTTKRFLVLPVLSTVALALVVACGASDTDGPPSIAPEVDGGRDDGSSSGFDPVPGTDGGPRPDADPDPGERPQLLVRGEVVVLGMTTDDHAIFTRPSIDGRSLEAVSLADGVITTIWSGLPAGASVDVKGNAVGIWTDIDASTGLGAFSYWTPGKTTRRNVGELSVRDWFWATADGALLAFESNVALTDGVPTSAELAVVSTATGALTTVLTGAERIAFDETSCGSHIGFAGTTLVVAYCPSGSDTARLVTVPNVDAPVRRVLVDGGLRPWWRADATGAQIFVIAQDQDEGRVVTNDGTDPAPSVAVETAVREGFMIRDGSAVVYRTGMTLRRAPLGGAGPIAPVTITSGDARGILDVSGDQTRILYHALEGVPVDVQNPDGDRYFDLRSIATTATDATPNVLVDTERALPLSFTGDASHALYFSRAPRLVSVATDGSGERSKQLDFNRMDVAPSGSRAVLTVNSRQLGESVVTDLVLVDFSRSGSEADTPKTKTIAESVGSGGYRFGVTSPNAFVYAQLGTAGAGLYRIELP